MYRPSADPSALRALTDDPAVEQEFSNRAKWQREEEALNAYEDVAYYACGLSPASAREMVQPERWETALDRMEDEDKGNDYDLYGRTE